VALDLISQTDLLFVGPQRAPPWPGSRVVVLLDDGSAAAARGRQVAEELARSLRTTLQVLRWPDGDEAALLQSVHAAATCVLPREQATSARLRHPPCPMLLVS
jgi:hypothetical protein